MLSYYAGTAEDGEGKRLTDSAGSLFLVAQTFIMLKGDRERSGGVDGSHGNDTEVFGSESGVS